MPVGNVPFSKLQTLKDVVFPDGVEVIGAGWFKDSGVQTVSFPESVREIGERAFMGCTELGLVAFTIMSKLEKIGKECFRKSGLKKILVPPRLRELSDGAFLECRYLTHVWFREDGVLEKIGNNCF